MRRQYDAGTSAARGRHQRTPRLEISKSPQMDEAERDLLASVEHNCR